MSAYTPLANGFYPELERVSLHAPWQDLAACAPVQVEAALAADRLSARDLLVLLSPAAIPYLEHMARRAQAETLRCFGRGVQLFTPLYLANYCTNRCLYCGFNARRTIERRRLAPEEAEAEAKAIAATGLRRILALTGDAPAKTGADYLAVCVKALARHFPSVGIEVPSMTIEEYALVVQAGADGMTMFQETYNRELYLRLHPAGPKRDFAFRLDAPERAALGGMRGVNLGALLGLDDWRRDIFLTALHAEFLIKRYPHLEVSVSLPRMRPCGEKPDSPEERAFTPLTVGDRDFVQALTALRCFLPQVGITLSTREPAALRDRLIPLGVTRVSAGVSTAVGGHAQAGSNASDPQFEISDPRSVDEMAAALTQAGFQPIFTDWLLPGQGQSPLAAGLANALRPPEQAGQAQGHAA